MDETLGAAVRSARRAGEWRSLRNSVSVSAAATIACFQLSCTGDSAADTIRVPICTPSAPRAKAAAIVAPSMIPPAAMIGTSTRERTSGSSTIVATGVGLLKPPPSPPSTTSPSTPASTAFSAAASVGTTWYTVSPASLSTLVYLVGEPADVVTNLTPWSITNSAMFGSRTKAWAMLTPNGRSVRSRIRRISSLTASSSPDEVSMIPQAPAWETADARRLRAIQPIGAWTIGISTPRARATLLSNASGRFTAPSCSQRRGGSRSERSQARPPRCSALCVSDQVDVAPDRSHRTRIRRRRAARPERAGRRGRGG